MSFPYERLLGTLSSRPPSRPASSLSTPSTLPRPPSTSGAASSSGSIGSSASAKKPQSIRKSKPSLPFYVRPRFRFDLPDPPMDPKMLLGPISTTSYAKPYFSDLERDHRPVAIPSDPSHALRVNLVTHPSTPALPSPTAANGRHPSPAVEPQRHCLSIDDDALLQSIMTSRPGATAAGKSTLDGVHRRAGASSLGGVGGTAGTAGNPSRSGPSAIPMLHNAQPAANSVSNAPWMRRMSYDEYFAPSTARPSSRHINSASKAVGGAGKGRISKQDAAARRANQQRQLQERRRNQLLVSFGASRKAPVHPDVRKAHLKPVSITPVLPNLSSLLEDLISVEFEPDEVLTLEHRPKKNPAVVKESVRSMATVSLTDGTPLQPRQEPKKFAACYTPTDHTLERRKRRRQEAIDDGAEDEVEESEGSGKRRKIHFVEDESYEWFGEYSIREGKYGGVMSRSCFAVDEWKSNDGKKTVATFARIGTSWKLARRPFREDTVRLGKEGLKISRLLSSKRSSYNLDPDDDDVRRSILAPRPVKQEVTQGNGVKRELLKAEDTL